MERYIPFSDEDPKEAVAMWGGAREDLEYILKTGKILPVAPYNITLPIYQRIIDNGLSLYFTTIVLENLKKNDPKYAGMFIRQFNSTEEALTNLGFEQALSVSKGYAERRALIRPFTSIFGDRLTNFDVNTVVDLAIEYLPQLTHQQIRSLQQQAQYDDWREPNNDHMNMIKRTISENDLQKILSNVVNKRGVLFYCKKTVLDYDCRVGYEADDELLITPNRLLSSDILIGAQCRTDFDLPFST